jgi:hypothetical protein
MGEHHVVHGFGVTLERRPVRLQVSVSYRRSNTWSARGRVFQPTVSGRGGAAVAAPPNVVASRSSARGRPRPSP